MSADCEGPFCCEFHLGMEARLAAVTSECVALKVSWEKQADLSMKAHARLAAVEAERDAQGRARYDAELRANIAERQSDALSARLAAVEALCDEMTGFCCDAAPDWAADIRAAAQGEGRG